MIRPWRHPAILVSGTLAACVFLSWLWQRAGPLDMEQTRLTLIPVAFADIDGWERDDPGQAWAAFRRSCARIAAAKEAHALVRVCRAALAESETMAGAAARAFFERHFTPHRVAAPQAGFLTGYYEPEVQGSRTRDERYAVPLYGRPDDLIVRAPDAERARYNNRVTGFRRAGGEELPYWTREEIEAGALEGRGLELVYLDDAAEAFLMQVQGSGTVVLPDGTRLRLGYAAKNGHPYTSIGRLLVERGEIANDAMSLEALKAWLRADPERGARLMRENRSFVFFRPLSEAEGREGPVGAHGVALAPGRSLAVDASYHALGLPVWVAAPTLDAHGATGFARLMIAQDVGSAIRGPERGDIFWGSGAEAGRIAGLTRAAGRFTVLLPKDAAGA